MSSKNLKLVIVASTGGAVMNELLKNIYFRSQIHSVVSDRECDAIEKANRHNVKSKIFEESKSLDFCNQLLEYLEINEVDYIISFYTKLFKGDILNSYKNKIINLHPSILPAFKGLNAFEDNLNFGSRYIGSTIHFIDEKMDEGKIIIQTSYPLDYKNDISFLRHRIFIQQCKSLLQVIKWLSEDRIKIIDGKVEVINSLFRDFQFSPSLDFEEAINLNIPIPSLREQK